MTYDEMSKTIARKIFAWQTNTSSNSSREFKSESYTIKSEPEECTTSRPVTTGGDARVVVTGVQAVLVPIEIVEDTADRVVHFHTPENMTTAAVMSVVKRASATFTFAHRGPGLTLRVLSTSLRVEMAKRWKQRMETHNKTEN